MVRLRCQQQEITMKQNYIVEFNASHTQDGWSRMEFTSISKALGFVSLMVKRGAHCQIFQAVTTWPPPNESKLCASAERRWA